MAFCVREPALLSLKSLLAFSDSTPADEMQEPLLAEGNLHFFI